MVGITTSVCLLILLDLPLTLCMQTYGSITSAKIFSKGNCIAFGEKHQLLQFMFPFEDSSLSIPFHKRRICSFGLGMPLDWFDNVKVEESWHIRLAPSLLSDTYFHLWDLFMFHPI